MTDRLLITLVVIGGLGVVWVLWQPYKRRLIQTIQPGSELTGSGQATLLYFTGAYCQACKYQQTPIITELAAHLGDRLTIHTYDVSEQPALAQHYKVMTLPSTVILTGSGQVADINYGVASRQKLAGQLAQAAARPAGPALRGQLPQAS